MPSDPILPSFDGVRLATPEDLHRIATVAAAGFFHSPVFRFQRVHYAKYPDDTLLSYYSEYHQAILDPACVVLVAEDALKENEGDAVYNALRDAAAYCPGAGSPTLSTVVAVASINIRPGSPYIGRFQTTGFVDPRTPRTVPDNLNRDSCPIASQDYAKATAPAKAKYLAGQMRLSTLAVHPAYWRRSHATRLVSWATRLADLDGVSVGISAVPMGATIALKAGFEERELVRVKRSRMHDASTPHDNPDVREVKLWVAIRRPSGSPVTDLTDESTTSVDS